MAKTLVTFLSTTGNTRALAEAVFEALPNPKTLLPIQDVRDLDSFDLIFVGFPVQAHSVPVKAEAFLKRIPKGKKIAFFSTHGSLKGHRLSLEAIEHAVVTASQAKVLGTFSCRGNLSPDALEFLGKSPEHQEWTAMAPSASTHPDGHDLEEARAFARWILTLALQRA